MDNISANPIGSLIINANNSPQRTSSNLNFASQLRGTLSNGASVLSNVAGNAAPYVPGAAAVNSLLKNASNQISVPSVTGFPNQGLGGGGGMQPFTQNGTFDQNNMSDSVNSLQERMINMNVYMLGVQQQFHQLTTQFSTISNCLKAKYDAEKNSISNIR